MLDFDMLTAIVSGIILGLVLLYMKYKRKIENTYLIFYSVFFIYMIGVLKYTIFPIPVDPFMKEVMVQNTSFLKGVNLIPFNFKSISDLLTRQVFLNIVLSMPFGFGISYIARVSKKKVFGFSILFGIIIETIQLIISLILGFAYRYIDINDVILNFIGAIIGYFIFRMFSVLFIKLVRRFSLELDSISMHIYKVGEEANLLSRTKHENKGI